MKFRFPISLAAAWAVAGCTVSPEQALAGNYIVDGKRTELPAAANIGVGVKRLKQAFGTMTLKLRADKTFLLAGGIAAGGTTEGTWTLDEKGVTLIPKGPPRIKGAPDRYVLTPNSGKDELTFVLPTPFGDFKAVLVKNAT